MPITKVSLSRRQTLAMVTASALMPGVRAFAETRPDITVHKDPKCGCCAAWVEHLKQAGFPTTVVETSDLKSIKERLGVPENLSSCHTAQLENYVIEGHVPVEAIVRLLRERPNATGLAVPGMPIGSPGMEGGPPEVYEVVLFGAEGQKAYGRFLEDRAV